MSLIDWIKYEKHVVCTKYDNNKGIFKFAVYLQYVESDC